jgi:uncharacterized protein involved in outer membrane biogenesis/outer membrane protein OmpA-like peptidoglycan-associated protein
MNKVVRRIALTLLLGSGLYALLGFLILPGIALRIANQQLANYATVPAQLQRIQLNPFSLELSLWGLRIGEADAEQLGFDRLYLDLQLDSLWRNGLHLRNIELEGAKVDALRNKEGELNLTQLFNLPASEPAPADQPPGPLPALKIDRIALIEGALRFRDLQPQTPFEFDYDSLNLELHNLSTMPEENADLTLSARGPGGGELDWSGRISVNPLRSSGTLQLRDGKLKAIWPYVRDIVPIELADGVVEISTDYQLALGEVVKLNLEQLSVKLDSLALQAPDQRPLLNLASLEISETSVDLANQQVVIGQLRSQQLETWAAREKDGQLDWQKLLATPAVSTQPAAPPQPAAPAETPETSAMPATPATEDIAASAEPARPWQIILKDGQLRDYRVHLADRQPAEAVELELGPLNLDVQNFDSLGQTPFAIKLDTGLGKQGRISAEGPVQLNPPSTTLQVSTADIDLRVAQAYISPFIRLELRSGMLASQLQVALPSVDPLQLRVSGNVQVSQLHTLDTLKKRDFVRWQQLQLQGLDYQHTSKLRIDKVSLTEPYLRFIVNEDLSTNVSDLLIAQAPSSSSAPAASGPPLAIQIGGVQFKDGSANFADFSLTPDFATAIQQLEGSIGRIDSVSQQPASIDIRGKVDRYAPVSIQGSLNPFDPLASLDIATSFKRVELTTLTPYSGKFAGYRIRKGRLNLDLHYRIEKGQLNADNKLVLESLQLGEQVQSGDAVDLPIRLAVALLKDAQGNIDIELPISGDLNNPEFSIAPIIWQTLSNLIVRAVQAPFNFIAGLAGGSDVDLGQVPFSDGSSELEPAAMEVLDTLARALQERPTLRLEVEGTSSVGNDGALLARQRLQSEFQSMWYSMLQRRGDKVPENADELEVPDDMQESMLEGIYRARLKQQPPPEWAELDDEVRADNLRQALLAYWESNPTLLRRLAQARAAAIKEHLVQQGGLDDQRIYLVDVSVIESTQPGRIDTVLHLDSE